MKAKAVLLMLLIALISYTGFAKNHSDPGQNSTVVVTDIGGYTISGYMATDTPSFETIKVMYFIVVPATISMPVTANTYMPPDTLCINKHINQAVYVGSDTIRSRHIIIDRYRIRNYEIIKVKPLPHLYNKPRDKLIRN